MFEVDDNLFYVERPIGSRTVRAKVIVIVLRTSIGRKPSTAQRTSPN